MPTTGTTDDLQWTAFLYIAGELPAADLAAFEARLGDDQSAREAVAAAVELAGAAFLAGDGPILALPRRSPVARRVLAASLAAVAAAACLFLIVRPAGTAPGPEVARAWSGFREETDGDWAAVVAEGREPAAPHEAEPLADVESDETAERGVPSWMLAAAAGPKAETPTREGN